MKFLRIEKSLTSAENVVLTIVNRREGATLLNCDECHSIEVRKSDLLSVPDLNGAALILRSVLDLPVNDDGETVADFVDELDEPAVEVTLGTIQGL